MKLYPKFAFLLCHEANFAAVKLELLKMLKATASTASSSSFKGSEHIYKNQCKIANLVILTFLLFLLYGHLLESFFLISLLLL